MLTLKQIYDNKAAVIAGLEKKHFAVKESFVVNDGMNTLFSADNIALYNRKKFIQLGGFDYSIKSKYYY